MQTPRPPHCFETTRRAELADGVCEGARGEDLTRFRARVTVRMGKSVQSRDIAAGASWNMSTHDPRLHFGLGQAATVDEVDVRWPDGSHSVRRNVAARQFLRIRKGS